MKKYCPRCVGDGRSSHVPTVPRPSEDRLFDQLLDGSAEATDGCIVEPDASCKHGHPAWTLVAFEEAI